MADAPKYLGELTKKLVKLFLTNFSLWGRARNMSSRCLKFQLPLSFSNVDASRWFSANMEIVYDENVSFEELCQIFMDEAPFCFENNLTLSDLQSEKQTQDESTSSYILRVLCEAGDVYHNATECSWIDAFMRNMFYKVSDFIDTRGHPANIAQLRVLVHEYESNKDSRPIANESSNQFQSAVTDLKATLSMIRQELAEIKQSTSINGQPKVEANMSGETGNTSSRSGQSFEPVDFAVYGQGHINQVKIHDRINAGIVNKHSPLINVSINGHHQEALLDSGACCSLVGFSIAKWFPRIQSSRINISSVTNFSIQNFGVALVPIQVGCSIITFPFVVVEDSTADLVLGSDFMRALKVSLNIGEETVTSSVFGTVQIVPCKTGFLEITNIEHLVKIEEYSSQSLPISQVAQFVTSVKPKPPCVPKHRFWQQNTPKTPRTTNSKAMHKTNFPYKRFNQLEPQIPHPENCSGVSDALYSGPNFKQKLQTNCPRSYQHFKPG